MAPRTAVVALLVLLATACAADGAAEDLPGSATPPSVVEPTTTSTPPQVLPPPWSPLPNEPVPEIKVAAARTVEALLNYPLGEGTEAAAAARMAALGLPPQLASDVAPLLVADALGTAEVVYPQLGGLAERSASVMVVTRVEPGTGDDVASSTRTIDVRLERADGGWRAASLASLGAPPDKVADPTAAAEALTQVPALDLPDTAIWDLRAGIVEEPVVALLQDLADTYELRVTVLASGHPLNVFDRDTVSNHTHGRGVDIWAVDGVPVAEQQGSPTLRAIVDRSLALGATEVGAPFDIDGPGGRVFTNTVHQDHLHLAFEAPRSS